MKTSSIHFKPVLSNSESHNKREVVPDYVIKNVKEKNGLWQANTIAEKLEEIKNLYSEKVKQKWQEKMTPIKEAVVILDKASFKNEEGKYEIRACFNRMGLLIKNLKSEFGITCFQIHAHFDEGKKMEGKITPFFERNLHAHMIFDWQDKETGKMRRLSPSDMKRIQTLTAEALNLPRGKENSKSERLEHGEYRKEMERLNLIKNNLLQEIEEKKKKASLLMKSWENLKKI